MAREPRIVVVGVPHHIYLRGNNRRRLFSNEADRWLWLRCLEQGLEASECLLHQHTLMTNHMHLMATPPHEKAFATLMKRACQRYAQQRNDQMNASGKLFEERYQSKVITDEDHMMFNMLYNDANAFRAGQVDDPNEHEWSTGPLHAGRGTSNIPRSMWTPSGWYLGLGRTAERRESVYRQLMTAYLRRDGVDLGSIDESPEKRYRQRIARPDGSSAMEGRAQWGRKPK